MSETVFVCKQGYILSWHGAVRKYEEQKDVYNRGISCCAEKKNSRGGIMAKEKENAKKGPGDSFGQMLTAFGSAISEIFNDPELKEKAKEFGDAAAESAKALAKRFKDEEVKEKLSDAGKAAQDFGKTVAEHFQAEDKK